MASGARENARNHQLCLGAMPRNCQVCVGAMPRDHQVCVGAMPHASNSSSTRP